MILKFPRIPRWLDATLEAIFITIATAVFGPIVATVLLMELLSQWWRADFCPYRDRW